MLIRKATAEDLDAIDAIFAEIHTAEESGPAMTGWEWGIYPTAATVKAALNRDDLFVQEDDGKIIGTGIINQQQVDVYPESKLEL